MDNNKKYYKDRPVIDIYELNKIEFDYIVISSQFVNEIYKQLIGVGVEKEKIIPLLNREALYFDSINNLNKKTKSILKENNFIDDIGVVSVKEICKWNNEDSVSYSSIYYTDYIRIATFKLIAKEIKDRNIKGNLAELGVFRGDFAEVINREFPDKKLYLFDTFEGFSKNDIEKEKNLNLSNAEIKDFNNTSVDLVLNKMENIENVVLKKGYFPNTTKGLEDLEFCFVSLDADLYNPIYEGLEYFYPRLSKGGYIFVHDYNNENYPGVKKALEEYAKKNELSMFPLTDKYGTMILQKL